MIEEIKMTFSAGLSTKRCVNVLNTMIITNQGPINIGIMLRRMKLRKGPNNDFQQSISSRVKRSNIQLLNKPRVFLNILESHLRLLPHQTLYQIGGFSGLVGVLVD